MKKLEINQKKAFRVWEQGATRRRSSVSWDRWEAELLGTEGDMFEIGECDTLEEARTMAWREWNPRTSKADAYNNVFIVERITDEEDVFQVEQVIDFWGEMLAEEDEEDEEEEED